MKSSAEVLATNSKWIAVETTQTNRSIHTLTGEWSQHLMSSGPGWSTPVAAGGSWKTAQSSGKGGATSAAVETS